MKRSAKVERKTSETDISISLKLDGAGASSISTTIPFIDHMLSLMARHGLFDLKIKAKGDTDIDCHHTVEDIGICLGEAFKKALGDMKGISRYGSQNLPMDETLVSAAVDISGRPYLVYNVKFPRKGLRDFDISLFKEFFQAFSSTSRITLHINLVYGNNAHHICEAVFKAFGRSLRQAVSIDPRIRGVLSTKGKI
ncbi:MAG: imidazoleglycerol-phosphate dehydratase [Candidatus Schekmanbacteria bacterium RIFCSPHIGHO2_02_FULL_38_11]|uniref:Imidazoleglycerol-phosphate dehydratase n=1 Tax=Candidatus Schekmanbacteria bacterium RIFCSPLOWO2_12_FULL_38_15 TaxID=1817883 RepID=A0A1F7SDH7_9BACT|nr:MAG: imidazoleglycerol-phosphate dehydratase [Candidatus Schekmanbacteria bacterium RIFCSPHIGHO2_02_FULL_38_11]OGL51489.1 MAG: imidazoleglycerol-phosphate dehydratase [Candidatus Schekmanbacteria bacterium RIFCSPLOWO2_02_FULL_38_14]OGL51839.1 MAG: imidazoleglycerol-phosphate dehydratase [Candidatus Schekmanbacteria bacterium RIFCSPLOWO2_12_FULL_38_15]